MSQHRDDPARAPLPAWEVLFSPAPRVLSTRPRQATAKHRQEFQGAVVGKIVGHDKSGRPLVAFRGSPREQGVPARTTVVCSEADVGKEVVLLFEHGQMRRPIIMGILQVPQGNPPLQATLDGERLVLTAEKEIVLKCGSASLTLTRAGKVLLQGTYVSSCSSGVNRIKGGSVQIN